MAPCECLPLAGRDAKGPCAVKAYPDNGMNIDRHSPTPCQSGVGRWFGVRAREASRKM